MKDTVGMKLVFRIADCAFSLPVEDLLEIRENSVGLVDRSSSDAERLVLGELFHRGEKIDVRDLGGRLKVTEPGRDRGRAILVLAGREASWGIVVDRVEGLFPESEFTPLALPPLLSRDDRLPYGGLDRWNDELLVQCEAQRLETAWGGR